MHRSLFFQGYLLNLFAPFWSHIPVLEGIESSIIFPGLGSFSETTQAWILRCIFFYHEYFRAYTPQRILGNFPLGLWILTLKLYVFYNLCEVEDIFASAQDVSLFYLDSNSESLSWFLGSQSYWQQVCLQTRGPDLWCG